MGDENSTPRVQNVVVGSSRHVQVRLPLRAMRDVAGMKLIQIVTRGLPATLDYAEHLFD